MNTPPALPLQVFVVEGFDYCFRTENGARAYAKGLRNKRKRARIFASQNIEWEEL
jgi:hypothetical protein